MTYSDERYSLHINSGMSKNIICERVRACSSEMDIAKITAVMQKATSYELQNGISAICLNWDQAEARSSSQVPPIVLRANGSLSTLIEVSELQHMENVLSIIQTKKFLRDNLPLYLSLRDPSSHSFSDSIRHSSSGHDPLSQKALADRVDYIQKHHHLFGERFESGIADYFMAESDKIVSEGHLGAEVHPHAQRFDHQ